MPQYWIVGWERFCEGEEEKGGWRFACGPIIVEEPPKLNTPIKVMEPNGREWTEYILTNFLGQSSTRFLTALERFSEEVNDQGTASALYDILNELAMEAYEAGRRGIVPPADADV